MDDIMIDRRLSPSENLWWVLDQECRCNFVIRSGITGPTREEVLRQGLKAVQVRHPMLRVRVERDGWNSLSFQTHGAQGIPLRIEEAPPNAWIKQAEKELHEELPVKDGPLVRCTLVRHTDEDHTVLIAFHHAILDAISGSFPMAP